MLPWRDNLEILAESIETLRALEMTVLDLDHGRVSAYNIRSVEFVYRSVSI
jgi:hypothetical protein